jgi:hypothetical protein
MLERTRTRLTSRFDEPCLGVDHLVPSDSEANHRRCTDLRAGPLLPSVTRAALR